MATIKQLREATGKPRSQVASDLNMSERHLYRLENALSPLRRVVALGFSTYYGVPITDIDHVDDEKTAA